MSDLGAAFSAEVLRNPEFMGRDGPSGEQSNRPRTAATWETLAFPTSPASRIDCSLRISRQPILSRLGGILFLFDRQSLGMTNYELW